MNPLLIRAGWPAPLCKHVANGEHEWTQTRTGIICARCTDFIPWDDCQAYQRWCRYVLVTMTNPEARLN